MDPSTSTKRLESGKDPVSDCLQASKKVRTETGTAATKEVINDSAVIISVPTVIPNVIEIPEEEILCAICMGSDGNDIKLLKTHNCPTCVPGAWSICDVCDDNLLSRSCPVCNSDYSPRVLYVAPGMPTFPIPVAEMSNPQLVRKICAIGKLVSGSNVAVWSPMDNKMHFFLPQEFTDISCDFRSLSVVITVTPDKVNDGQFLFNNQIWDALLKEMEEGVNSSDEIMVAKDTMRKIFSTLNSEGSQLLTQLRPEEWSLFDD
jgi:hypothetical protein